MPAGIATDMALEANPASRSARLSLSDCPVDQTCILPVSGYVDANLCLSPLADEGRRSALTSTVLLG